MKRKRQAYLSENEPKKLRQAKHDASKVVGHAGPEGLRIDLVRKLTPELLLKEVLANQHRYKPEPSLSTTGKGYLKPATPEDVIKERNVRRSINRAVLKKRPK